jgi:hypothetical protein
VGDLGGCTNGSLDNSALAWQWAQASAAVLGFAWCLFLLLLLHHLTLVVVAGPSLH